MNELERRYRARLAEIRSQILAALNRLYDGTVTGDDLDASFAAFTPRAASLLLAGQSRGISLATGYLSALITLMGGRVADLRAFTGADLIGFTTSGVSLEQGMDAIPSMVKQQIGKGADIAQALDYGKFLSERFGDGEVLGVIDRHTELVTAGSGEFTGWEGIVSGGACEPCGANAGFHDLSEPIYRHGSCNCTKQYIVAA